MDCQTILGKYDYSARHDNGLVTGQEKCPYNFRDVYLSIYE